MRDSKEYLKTYKLWMESGRMSTCGLCATYGLDELFWLLKPTSADFQQLIADSDNTIYWGSGGSSWEPYIFTPLRQTIVLFMYEMAKEDEENQ